MAPQLQRKVQMNRQTIRERGFSLIELLIVVMVILVLAVIAVPNLIRSKIAANEASAIQTVRQISTAEMTYNNSYPSVGFSPDLPSLGGPAAGCMPDQTHACILDSAVVSGSKSGYKFFAAGFVGAGLTANTTFVASSAPLNFNTSGVRMFCLATDDGSVRWKQGSAGAPPALDVPTCIAYSLM
jgi:type IV pilus assembly protein PilA